VGRFRKEKETTFNSRMSVGECAKKKSEKVGNCNDHGFQRYLMIPQSDKYCNFKLKCSVPGKECI
jgi:hypothetical protein